MFKLNHQDGAKPKCYFTHSILPAYLDHAQLPMKKRPFATIRDQTFNHMLNVLIPADRAELLRKSLENDECYQLSYVVVYMKLIDIVSGVFFSEYIKKNGSNILMLSEGRRGLENTFSLHDGVLRLEIDKATFERMGLEGKPIPHDGRKHVHARYAIEINLRLPSMVRGKPSFERILWAFRNVLNHSTKWLFYDLKNEKDDQGPIAAHAPIIRQSECQVEKLETVKVPHFPPGMTAEEDGGNDEEDNDENAADLLEWLTLSFISSPRIKESDNIDSTLSRYTVPSSSTHECTVQDLVKLSWSGLLPPTFIQKILLSALKAVGKESWFALRAQSLDGKSYVFIQENEHTLTWEYES